MKIRYGLSESSAYYSTISETLKQLAGQMDRSFGYYKAQFHIERIDRLVVYGGTSKMINMDKFLSEELGIYAEIGLPLNGLLFDQKAFENIDDFAGFFGMAIGAALNSGNAKRIASMVEKKRIFLAFQIFIIQTKHFVQQVVF